MAKSKSARVDLGGGLAIEYLKGRGVLRVHGSESAVEVPLNEVLDQLGIEITDVLPSGQFLLFAGDDWPAGGVADLVGTYSSEAEARDAFRRLRLLPAARNGWAQLVVIRANGRLEHLSWFGREPAARSPRRGLFRRRAQATVRIVGDSPLSPGGAPPPPPRHRDGERYDPDVVTPIAAMLSSTLSRPEPPSAGGRVLPPGGRRPRPGQRR